MKRISVMINPAEWDHLVTKYPPDSKHLTIANFTDGTKNIDSDAEGVLTKRPGGTIYSTLPTSAKDQYEAVFADGTRQLLTVDNGNLRYSAGDGAETLVTGGYSTAANFEFVTTQDRVYFDNGVDAPQVYDRNTTYGGVTYTAPRTRNMGAQPPLSAVSFAADTNGGAVPAGAHTYKVTFLYYGFEESNGGPSSVVHTVVNPNNTVNLTAIPIGGYGVTARKIYRDNNDGNYVLIFTILNNTATTFSDTLLTGATPTPIPTDNNLPPTYALIALWLEHVWVAKVPGNPYDLFYSEAGLPDIFPVEFTVTCNEQDPITALVVYAGRLIVFNRRSMGQILGSTSNDFRYDTIQNVVGCVDTRTVQVRVVQGVPLLIWLSDRGFYSYDGNSVTYISDPIEDLVNFNIQQTLQQRGSNSQATQAQFQAGTPSNGIDLLTSPGEITTKNPERIWQSEADWEGGSDLENIVTRNGLNTIQAITEFNPDLKSGTVSTAILTDGLTHVELPIAGNFTGEDNTGATIDDPGTIGYASAPRSFAQPINAPSRAGTITSISLGVQYAGAFHNIQFTVWSDLLGSPGSVLYTGPNHPVFSNGFFSDITGISIAAGQKYWIGYVADATHVSIPVPDFAASSFSGGRFKVFNGSTWNFLSDVSTVHAGTDNSILLNYFFSQSPVSSAGSWTSQVYDTFSAFVSGTFKFFPNPFNFDGVHTHLQYIIEASNDPMFISPTTVATFTDINSPVTGALSNFRYWRLRIILSTTDDRLLVANSSVTLQFTDNTSTHPAIWISEAVDCTSDVTAYDSLVVIQAVPAGGSTIVDVATSADNIAYTSFGSFGSAVVQRYFKVRVRLSTDSTQDNSPSISSITFTWTIVANLISSAIDTTLSPPAGWDVFAAAFQLNGGLITFQMRSATTALGLNSATFFTVLNGAFPPAGVVPLRFVQWKVILTSTANNVPEVSGVTVTWFISIVNSIRPASLFVNGKYYLAVATFGSITNNIVIELDLNSKWRIYRDLTISTLSFFFNKPYYGSAINGTIVQWLTGLQDQGVNIPIDIRFKDLTFDTQGSENASFLKTLDYLVFEGRGTGATYTFYFSVDNGATFTMLKYENGATSYPTVNDDKAFFVRFKTDKSDGNLVSGRTIMIRITTNDAFDIAVQSLKVYAWMYEFEPFLLG